MKFVLIRHGEINSNLAKVYSGRSDEPLNETGRDQALSAAMQLQAFSFGGLFTSPLRRARETAQIIGARLSLQPFVIEEFNELRMGPWEGLSEAEVEDRYPEAFRLWNRMPADLSLPGRETLTELQKRAVMGVMQAAELCNDGCFAIVSHVAVIRALVLFTEMRPLNDYKRVAVANASPVVLEWNHTHIKRGSKENGW